MARFEVTNGQGLKMYSVVGSNGTADELVLNGYVGERGGRIEDNVYKFVKLTDTSKDVFFIATPEVDADESKNVNNSLYGFKNELGEIQDAVLIPKHRKFAISEDGIVGTPAKGGYLYAKSGEWKLQFKATKPDPTTDKAILIAEIEDIVPATKGLFVGMNGANLALNYNIVRAIVI